MTDSLITITQGDQWLFDGSQDADAMIVQVVDYRGDVALHLTDGQILEGYVFDRKRGASDPYCRIWLKKSDDQTQVPYKNITKVVFTGRDTAAGRSWETWVKSHAEKKAQGETARLDPLPLDED